MRKRIILACGLLVLIYGLLYFSLGSKGGRGFFSPDTLQTRTQSEVLLFSESLPLYRSSFEYHQHELVKFLVDQGYWQPRNVPNPQWILLFHWNEMWRDGYTFFQHEFFRYKVHWIEWTKSHPQEAAQFWPQILKLLRADEHEKAGELLGEKRMRR